MTSSNSVVPTLASGCTPLGTCFRRGVYSYNFELPVGPQALPDICVIKVHRLDSLDQERGFRNMLAALLNERAAAPVAFQHRYISPFSVLDIGMISGYNHQSMLALVTPRYESGDVLNCVNLDSYAPRLSWIIQTAMAINHLHSHDIIHGHVHPGNILITDDENISLTDISVYSKACRWVLHPHATIPIRHSSLYQSRERLHSGTDALIVPTKPMDVYAFGSTVYTVFTGTAPFHGMIHRLEHAVLEIVQYGHMRIPKPPTEVISNKLWSIIQRCWARDPAARPEIGEVLTDLQDIGLYD